MDVKEAIAIDREARGLERAACAELVRAAGCSCRALMDSRVVYDQSSPGYGFGYAAIKIHDPRCPDALAAAIEAQGRT